jgi:mannose-1-phosphate guanylyltransferase
VQARSENSQKLYILILAGGSGERFWPLSRRSRPKQLLSLFSGRSLLEDTLARLDGLAPLEQILILTNRDQESAVRAMLPQMPAGNIVAEPAKRDTAAAIALGAGWISKRAPGATMVVLPADHLIKDKAGFQKTLVTAAHAAEQSGELVTVGIKPSWACPGFGYIEMGARSAGTADGDTVYEVVRFREKPNPELAETFLKQGNFRWNAGMFIWTIPSILSALHRHAPALAEFVSQIHAAASLDELLEKKFHALPKISIDYAVLEKARRVLMVEAGFDWDDVGSWIAVAKYLQTDGAKNCGNSALTVHGSSNNIVFSSSAKHVALMGVSDLIIVQTDDALLVCHRDEAEKIKNLVGSVPAELQ